jgi:hypothetical protein
MAAEFDRNGRMSMRSFHALSRGKICSEAMTASDSGVWKRIGAVIGSGRMRPS